MSINAAKQQGIVAVNDIAPEQAGAIILWRLSGTMDLDKLKAAFERLGLDVKELPKYPSPEIALRRAVMDRQEKHLLARSLPERGSYAMVREIVEKDDDERPLRFDTELTVHLVKGETLPDGAALEMSAESKLAEDIKATFRSGLKTLEAVDTGSWLCKMIYGVHAVPLRDTGGAYFVPRSTLPTWKKVMEACRGASATFFAEIPALSGKEAMEAILDAVTREAQANLEDIEKVMQEAASKNEAGVIGKRAAKTQLEVVAAQENKLATYEKLLDVNLDAIRERLTGLRANLAAAALQGGE